MKLAVTSILMMIFVLAGHGAPVIAQDLSDRVGDKTHGEEWQIRERERWFRETRALDEVERPDLLRAREVAALRRWLDEHRASSFEWNQLGPEGMSMLGWEMGPVSGRVSALAVHPNDEDVLYLGAASGGLWKTINGGASWAPLFDEVGTLTIGSILIEAGRPDHLWVGTGEQGQWCGGYFGQGLFLSTDAGQTFSAKNGVPGSALELSYVSSVAVHPTNVQIVLAGGHGWCDDATYLAGGLFRSTDGGASWQKMLSGPVSDIVVDPVDPSVMYAAMGRWSWPDDGIYRSDDAGASWNRLQTGVPFGSDVGRIRLRMAPSDHRVLYALVNNGANSESGLYRTTDGGASWALTNSDACEGQCSYNLCLDVHPVLSTRLLVGSIRFAESSNGGATLNYKTDDWGPTQEVHQDTHVVMYSQETSNRYWVGGDGGIWRTDDGGASFENLNANLVMTQFYDIEVHPDDGEVVFGGSQDNSSERRDGLQRWDVTVMTGDGFMNAVDPSQPATVFQTSYPWDGKPSIVKSTSGGGPNNFEWLSTTGIGADEPFPWVTPLVLADPGGADPSQLLVASNQIYRGQTSQPAASFVWTKISPTMTGGSAPISVLTPFANGEKVGLYVGTSNGKIWRTGNIMLASTTLGWTDVTGDYPEGYVSDIAVAPGDFSRVLVTSSEFGHPQLHRSTTGGFGWQAVGGGLPNVPANSVTIDPVSGNRVFVGTDVGVFVSHDFGGTFVPESSGLPLGLVVTDVEADASPYLLTIGTYGRGVFQADLDVVLGQVFSDGFESGDVSAWSAFSGLKR